MTVEKSDGKEILDSFSVEQGRRKLDVTVKERFTQDIIEKIKDYAKFDEASAEIQAQYRVIVSNTLDLFAELRPDLPDDEIKKMTSDFFRTGIQTSAKYRALEKLDKS